jgi:23S rRNA G2445 N2-methylase RlmL
VVAYGLVQIARFGRRDDECVPFLDPFCGSGTIGIEAASLGLNPVVAGDIDPNAVAGTRDNVAANGLEHRVEVRSIDATRLKSTFESSQFGTIVCNPPYGNRMRKRIDFRELYDRFLDGAAQLLRPRGRLVILTGAKTPVFESVFASTSGWRRLETRRIETGGIHPIVIVLQRDEGS